MMKKSFLYVRMAAIGSLLFFAACSKDNNEPEPAPSVLTLAKYETQNLQTGTQSVSNYPITGPLYVDWKAKQPDTEQNQVTMTAFGGLLRMMGGALLPQVLQSVKLSADGNVVATYINKPQLKTDSLASWGMKGMFGSYPSSNTINLLAATNGFTESPQGLATWEMKDDHFMLKLQIPSILSQTLKEKPDMNTEQLNGLITNMLSGDMATFRTLMSNLLQIDLSQVSDAGIQTLKDWATQGVPMRKTTVNSQTLIYLDKAALDPFFKLHTVNMNGEETQMCDLTLLLNLLKGKGTLPAEAAQATLLTGIISGLWSQTETFNLGLAFQ